MRSSFQIRNRSGLLSSRDARAAGQAAPAHPLFTLATASRTATSSTLPRAASSAFLLPICSRMTESSRSSPSAVALLCSSSSRSLRVSNSMSRSPASTSASRLSSERTTRPAAGGSIRWTALCGSMRPWDPTFINGTRAQRAQRTRPARDNAPKRPVGIEWLDSDPFKERSVR